MENMEKFWRGIDWPKTALTDLKSRLTPDARQAEVLSRRRAGETFTAIAKDMNLSPPAIRRLYLQAENKDAELRRTVKCPCCQAEVPIY